jgi:hypothetical protein
LNSGDNLGGTAEGGDAIEVALMVCFDAFPEARRYGIGMIE